MHRIRPHLTYANVVASLALFIALGGSAYAISTGAIGSREIRDNSIRGRDVRTNALSGRDINERSLRVAPRTYLRSSSRSITLSAAPVTHVTRCRSGDTALAGTPLVAGGGGYRVTGNYQPPDGYLAYVEAEPSGLGQRRVVSVVVACMSQARR